MWVLEILVDEAEKLPIDHNSQPPSDDVDKCSPLLDDFFSLDSLGRLYCPHCRQWQ